MSVYTMGRTVREFVSRYRLRSGLTQVQLGKKLGVTGQLVSNVERGVYRNPLGFVEKMSKVLPKNEAEHLAHLALDEKIDSIEVKWKRKRR